MRVFGKLMASAAALAFASSVTFVSAGAVPTGKLSVSSEVVLTAGKKAKGKKAGPGRCGVMKYWDKKTRSCADATTKKS
jgi:hypothetical protein